MQDHLVLLNDFSFNKVIEVPRVGNGEGLVVLSDDSLLEFSDVATTNQEIHAIMKVRSLNNTWLFSCIYTSTYKWKRRVLWKTLKNIKNNYSRKWLIGGDFNELLHNSKKKGGKMINQSCASSLKIWWTIVNLLIWVLKEIGLLGLISVSKIESFNI